MAYAIALPRIAADNVKMPEHIELCLLIGGKPFPQQSNAARLPDVLNHFAPFAHGSNLARTVRPKTPKAERSGNQPVNKHGRSSAANKSWEEQRFFGSWVENSRDGGFARCVTNGSRKAGRC
jgi:hypothetical protein